MSIDHERPKWTRLLNFYRYNIAGIINILASVSFCLKRQWSLCRISLLLGRSICCACVQSDPGVAGSIAVAAGIVHTVLSVLSPLLPANLPHSVTSLNACLDDMLPDIAVCRSIVQVCWIDGAYIQITFANAFEAKDSPSSWPGASGKLIIENILGSQPSSMWLT